jgi:capsular polysaccharide biosynthesis protein
MGHHPHVIRRMRIFLCPLRVVCPAPRGKIAAMLRQIFSDIDRATGGILRRVAGRDPAPAFSGPLVSLAADRRRVAGLEEYTVLQPPQTVRLDDERRRSFLARQTAVPHDDGAFQTEEVFLATLHDATFDPRSGAIWAADGSLVLDSIKNAGRLKHVAALPIAGGALAGDFSSIAGPISGNVFHWLIESLPRLYSLASYPRPIALLMPDTLPAARREQLAACLPLNVGLRLVPTNVRLRVERFVLPSFLTTQWDFACPPPDHLTYLRQRLLKAAGLSPSAAAGERLYISRDRARVRRVVNEAAVLDVLRPLGFRPCHLEDLPFVEQMRLFRDTPIVIAPHGAGLANLLFAGRIPVLELTSRAVSPVYFFLALALGQDYRYLYPRELAGDEPLPAPSDGRIYSTTRDLDITVDIDVLRAAVDEWR